MTIQRETAEERALFQRLRESYIESIPIKLAELINAWDQVQRENWQTDQVTVLKRLVHKLAGSGSSYGLPEITQAARKLEKTLDLDLLMANSGKQQRPATASADDYRALQAELVRISHSESRSNR